MATRRSQSEYDPSQKPTGRSRSVLRELWKRIAICLSLGAASPWGYYGSAQFCPRSGTQAETRFQARRPGNNCDPCSFLWTRGAAMKARFRADRAFSFQASTAAPTEDWQDRRQGTRLTSGDVKARAASRAFAFQASASQASRESSGTGSSRRKGRSQTGRPPQTRFRGSVTRTIAGPHAFTEPRCWRSTAKRRLIALRSCAASGLPRSPGWGSATAPEIPCTSARQAPREPCHSPRERVAELRRGP